MKLYWVDIETTGFEPRRDRILEISVHEALLAEPFAARQIYHAVLWCPEGWDRFDPAAKEMHAASGLLDECKHSRVSILNVEAELLELIPAPASDDRNARHVWAGASPHFDVGFIRHAFSAALTERFSHRLFDVSAVHLFCQSQGMPPHNAARRLHRTVADIEDAIALGQACATWSATELSRLQERVWDWLQDVNPGRPDWSEPPQRTARFLEEAIELAQATGLPAEAAHRLVTYVYERPAGDPPQEVGGVMTTLMALVQRLGIDIMGEARKEVERIERPEIRAKVRARQEDKDRVLDEKPASLSDLVRACQGLPLGDPSFTIVTRSGNVRWFDVRFERLRSAVGVGEVASWSERHLDPSEVERDGGLSRGYVAKRSGDGSVRYCSFNSPQDLRDGLMSLAPLVEEPCR